MIKNVKLEKKYIWFSKKKKVNVYIKCFIRKKKGILMGLGGLEARWGVRIKMLGLGCIRNALAHI